MSESKLRPVAVVTAPAALAAWWGAATTLTALSMRGFPDKFSIPVIVLAALSAAVLAALMLRPPPLHNDGRVTAYLCAFTATQAAWVFFAFDELTAGAPYSPPPMGLWDLMVMVFGGPVLALWTFFLVKAWVSRDAQVPSRTGFRGWWRGLSLGCAAAVAFLVVLVAANLTKHLLIGALEIPDVDYPLGAQSAEQWFITAIEVGLAGVAEEPVFVGVAMLLWPRLTVPNFLAALWLSSLARAGIHLYYAAGAGADTAAAVGVVILWCTIWSGFSLFLVYRTRMLWPVILAHGLQNTLMVMSVLLLLPDLRPGEELVAAYLVIAVLAVLAVLLIGTLSFLVLAVRRIWFGRFASRAALEPPVLGRVSEVGVSS